MAVLVKIAVDDKGNPKILEVNKNINKLKKSANDLGPVLEKAFAFAGVLLGLQKVAQGIGAATDEVLKYEQAMARIKGIGDITGDSLKSTSNLARDMAKHTEFSASAIAGAMLEVVKMGFKAEELKNVMPSMLDLASAAMMDLNYAATNTISTMNQFGMSKTIEEVTRATNVLATVLNATGSDAEDFMESMKYAGAVAKTTGMSFEETAAMMGVLADAGIKGTQAGTTLRSMFIRFMQPTGAVKEGLKKLNIEGKTLSEVLFGLKKQGLSVIDFLETFDRTAITGTMRLADEDAMNKLKELNVDLLAQAVKIKDVADLVRDNLTDSFKQLVNNLNEIALSIFDAFGDRPRDAIAGLIEQVQVLDKWVDTNHKTFQNAAKVMASVLEIGGKLASTVLPALVDNFKLISATIVGIMVANRLPGMVKNFEGLDKTLSYTGVWSKTFSGFASNVGLAATAATTLSVAIDAIYNAWSQMIDKNTANVAIKTSIPDLEKQRDLVRKLRDHQEDIEEMQNRAGWRNTNDPKKQAYYKKAYAELKALEQEYITGPYGGAEAFNFNVGNFDKSSKFLHNLEQRLQALRSSTKTTPTTPPTTPKPPKPPDTPDKDGKEEKIKPWMQLGVRGSFLDTGYEKFEPKLNMDKAWEAEVESYNLLSEVLLDIDRDREQKQLQAEYDAHKLIVDSYWSMGESIASIYETISMKKAQIAIDAAEKEKAAIEQRFDAEIAAASGSTFRREMAEQKKAKAIIEADKKIEAAKRAAEKRQKAIDSAMATANVFKAVIGTIAETHGSASVRIAAGAVVAGIVGSYLAELVAINYRDGSQGLVTGPGNATSDSVNAKVSAGEWVLSKRDVDKLGGPSSIQQAIDRGSSYTNNRSNSITINTVIGTKQYVRESLIPEIRKELAR